LANQLLSLGLDLPLPLNEPVTGFTLLEPLYHYFCRLRSH